MDRARAPLGLERRRDRVRRPAPAEPRLPEHRGQDRLRPPARATRLQRVMDQARVRPALGQLRARRRRPEQRPRGHRGQDRLRPPTRTMLPQTAKDRMLARPARARHRAQQRRRQRAEARMPRQTRVRHRPRPRIVRRQRAEVRVPARPGQPRLRGPMGRRPDGARHSSGRAGPCVTPARSWWTIELRLPVPRGPLSRRRRGPWPCRSVCRRCPRLAFG